MPKRPEYQYCKDKKLYRKQIKNAEGKYISLYGRRLVSSQAESRNSSLN